MSPDNIEFRTLFHEPLAYVKGYADFFGRRFKVDRRVYVPNPETEHLVKIVLDGLSEESVVLDVGTGCGNIAITIAKERQDIVVYGSDLYPEALEIARQNAAIHGVNIQFHESRYVDDLCIPEPTHILANLPYGDSEHLTPGNDIKELQHMPPQACFHPKGILKAYEELIESIIKKGWKPHLYFETGVIQKEEVSKIITLGFDWQYFVFPNFSITHVEFGGNDETRK